MIWFKRFALWLAVRVRAVPPVSLELVDAASRHVADVERRYPNERGEYRRHVVFSALRAEHPGEAKAACAFAVELAVFWR